MASNYVDVGGYLDVVLKRYRIVSAFVILGLIAGILIAIFRPPGWESTSAILVKPQPGNVQVNTQSVESGKISPVISALTRPNLPVSTIAYLSQSTTVAQMVEDQIGGKLPPGLRDPTALQQHVEVTAQLPEGNEYIIQVVATVPDKDNSQLIANTWANASVDYVNSQTSSGYFNMDKAQQQLQQSQQQWQQSQDKLNKFEVTSQLPQVSSQLAAASSLMNDYQAQINQIKLNLNNAALLKQQLQNTDGSAASSLPVLILSLSSFTSQASSVDVANFLPQVSSTTGSTTETQTSNSTAPSSRGSSQLLVQPTLQSLSALTPKQQVRFVDSLASVLRNKQSQLQSNVTSLDKQIGQLRSQLEQLSSERDRLVLDRNVQRDTYMNLQTLIREQQAENAIQTHGVTVAAQAIKPERSGLRGILWVLLGIVAGFIIGVFGAFLAEFARRPRNQVSTRQSVEGAGS